MSANPIPLRDVAEAAEEAPVTVVANNLNHPLIRGLPPDFLLLPTDAVPREFCYERIFRRMAEQEVVFARSRAIVYLSKGRLHALDAKTLTSYLERFGTLVEAKVRDGELRINVTNCIKAEADLILSSEVGLELLPEIYNLFEHPTLMRVGKELSILRQGYDAASKSYVLSDIEIPEVPVKEATAALLNLLRDFQFQSPSDKVRAIVAMITPAANRARLVDGATPINFVLADDSQAGKGYYISMALLIYGPRGSWTVVQNKESGGVGSFSENLSEAYLSGKSSIVIDNYKGRLDNQMLESEITEGEAQARVAHQRTTAVYTKYLDRWLSGNRIEVSRDMGNRGNFIQLLKRHGVVDWFKWREGGLHQHVDANRPYYLGCIYSVIREWHRQGCRRIDVSTDDHTFTHWAGSMGWIARNLFGLGAPMFEGHAELKAEAVDPNRAWVKELLFRIRDDGHLGMAFPATELGEYCISRSVRFWGAKSQPRTDVEIGRSIGLALKQVFGNGSVDDYATACIGGLWLTRTTRTHTVDKSRTRVAKYYVATLAPLSAEVAGAMELRTPHFDDEAVGRDKKY